MAEKAGRKGEEKRQEAVGKAEIVFTASGSLEENIFRWLKPRDARKQTVRAANDGSDGAPLILCNKLKRLKCVFIRS